ncbi:DUF1501 domain-containing protein [bacterium]|jgi:uncharacterized protein (DUF1501 family)|nr:DUF1501 domain-containing protein [bacterium]
MEFDVNLRLVEKKLSRRRLLGNAGVSTSLLTFGMTAPGVLCDAATLSTEQNVLVVVEMAGGNDGLNTVVPLRDELYRKARPNLAIGSADALPIDDNLGLHPSMRGMADLLENGNLSIVQGVGYENPNRSHFESMDIWHSCQRKGEPRKSGWIGRYLESANLEDLADPPALHLGNRQQPFALMSRDVRVPSIQSLEQFRLRAADSPDLRDAIRSLSSQSRADASDLLGFVQASSRNAIEASERMESAGVQYKPSEAYPETTLGRQLETVAKLIASGLNTRVYYVRIDGFDTHANQPGAHAVLLRNVSDAVGTLVRDVNAQGDGDRLLVMCFSEFGRRVVENASDGTDHGAAGPLFLAGNGVKPGVVGEHPRLDDLQNGDLKHLIDFRQVYAAILQKWMKCDVQSVLGAAYDPVTVFANS